MTDFPEFHIEPDWKGLATRYKTERDEARKECREWKRQVADLTKKLGDAALDQKPCFGVVSLKNG